METLAEVPEEETDNSGGMENGNMGIESGIEDRLRKLMLNRSSSSLSQQSGSNQTTEQQQLSSVQEEIRTKLNSEHSVNGPIDQNEQPLDEKSGSVPSTPQKDDKTDSAVPSISLPSTPQKDDSTTDSQIAATTTLSTSNSASPQSKKKLDISGSGQSGDQLRQLLLSTGQGAAASNSGSPSGGGVGERSVSPGGGLIITGASSSLSNGEVSTTSSREGRSPSPPSDEPKMSTADAQVGGTVFKSLGLYCGRILYCTSIVAIRRVKHK